MFQKAIISLWKDGKIVGIFDTEEDAITSVVNDGDFIETNIENFYLVCNPDEEFKKQATLTHSAD